MKTTIGTHRTAARMIWPWSRARISGPEIDILSGKKTALLCIVNWRYLLRSRGVNFEQQVNFLLVPMFECVGYE